MIRGKASTLEEAEMRERHTWMNTHPMHIDLTNTSACRYIYVCNVSSCVHVCILSCWHTHSYRRMLAHQTCVIFQTPSENFQKPIPRAVNYRMKTRLDKDKG